jgi:hypothetical protein
VHARNLFHTSVALWDAWAAYHPTAPGYLTQEKASAPGHRDAARAEALSHAAYRILRARFASSPGAVASLAAFDARMDALEYDRTFDSTEGDSPAALGNRIAQAVLAFGAADGSNEAQGFAAPDYTPVNAPLVVALAGTSMVDPNRWQPLALEFFIDQSGIVLGSYPAHLTPHWGSVTPFALREVDRLPEIYFDPGHPPYLGGEGSSVFIQNTVHILELSSHLDPGDGVYIDISPAVQGNRPLGAYTGAGHALNPATGLPYAPNIVKRGDWSRVLAEFWADGPDSETPPGHWNSIANFVSDQPGFEKRIGGSGEILDDLEWDVKLYLLLNGALHDAAVCAWGAKGYYDYARPISMVRHLAGLGQSSEPAAPDFHPLGMPLVAGLIERITPESSAPGERHAHMAFYQGELAVFAWPGAPNNPENTYSGVQWHRALEWVPYQRPTFVTPPFAGYVSGHSTFSRAAAEVLAAITGSPYFPGGLGEFFAPQDDYLEFEVGPSEDVHLQWATYFDAADESALSRIYGGIHPRQDDIPGRVIGHQVGTRAWEHAQPFLTVEDGPDDAPSTVHTADQNGDGTIHLVELLRVIQFYNSGGFCCVTSGQTTEDGYMPGFDPLQQACASHAADYAPRDWRVNLAELLRVIQLFNTGGYIPCAEGEDGFCPIAP